MILSLTKKIYKYLFVSAIFVVALVLERELQLTGLTVLLLSIFLFKKVSFKIVLFFSLIFDLFGSRLLGLSGIFISLLYILLSLKINIKIQLFCLSVFLYLVILRYVF